MYYEERLSVDLCKNILYIENSEQLSMFTKTSSYNLLKLLILFFLLPLKSTLAYLECDDGTGDDSCQSRAGPADKSKETFDTWYHEFNQYIESLRKDVDLAIYDDQRLAWAHTSFIQPQMMLHDKFIYDRTKNIWTVDKYLTDLKERYRIQNDKHNIQGLQYIFFADMGELIVFYFGKGILILV